MSAYLCFDFQTYTKMKQNIIYSSECVLLFLYPTVLCTVSCSIQQCQYWTSYLKPLLQNSSDCSWNHFSVADGSASSHVKWIHLRCFLRAASNEKADNAKSGLYGGYGTTSSSVLSIATEVATLVWGSCVNMLKKQWLFLPNECEWFVFSTSLGSVLSLVDFCQFSWISLLTFWFDQIVSCCDMPSRLWEVVQVHMSATITWFPHLTFHNTYVHSVFIIQSQ